MCKMLIVGADAVSPEIIFRQIDKFPNIKKLIDNGASASYSAYVQKGYKGSYSSEQNWASIYTGLAPHEHMAEIKYFDNKKISVKMKHFNELLPFWTVFNNNGISIGLWAADNCSDPVPIEKGYVVSSEYSTIESPIENRQVPREFQLCGKDLFVKKFIEGTPPPRIYPKTLKQQGYTFEQLKANTDLAEEALRKYNFEECLENFERELEYWIYSMIRTQAENPVDVLFFYTPTSDLIAHCTMNCDDNPVLIAAYQLLDKYVGKLIEMIEPEITILVSDHGQQNFKDLIKCSDENVQKEAFSARDEVIWLKNGYIAFEARNGALLYSAHSLKGLFAAGGKGIRNTKIAEMRTLDIYPTILEMLNVEVPNNRTGYVMDIFTKDIVNGSKFFDKSALKYKSVALIVTGEVNITDIIINELYLANRFSNITVVGYEKYGEIFSNNPRVSEFISFEFFQFEKYDEIYCGVSMENGKFIKHIKVYEKNDR